MNKLKWRTLTTEPCFWVMTSVSGQIEGLAVAYVDDFMVAIYEESPVSQKHFSEVKALYEWGEWESGSFTHVVCRLYSIGIRIAGLVFLCLVRNTRNRWFFWTCHQRDENSVMIL